MHSKIHCIEVFNHQRKGLINRNKPINNVICTAIVKRVGTLRITSVKHTCK